MPLSDQEEKELREKLSAAEGRTKQLEADAVKAKADGEAALRKGQEMTNKAKEYVVRVTSELTKRGSEKESAAEELDPDQLFDQMRQDPEGFLDEHFAKRMGPLLAQQHQEASGNARDLVRKELTSTKWPGGPGEDGNDRSMLDIYGEALDKFMEGMPPKQRSNPQAWREALNYVRLQNLDQETSARVNAQMKEREKEASLGTLVEGPTPAGSKEPVRSRLDADDIRLMKEFDMSEKDWIEMGGGDGGERLADMAQEID